MIQLINFNHRWMCLFNPFHIFLHIPALFGRPCNYFPSAMKRERQNALKSPAIKPIRSSQAWIPKVPKQNSQAGFQSKVPQQSSQAKFPNKVPQARFLVPKSGFKARSPSRVPEHGSQGSSKIPKSDSQARFPSKVPKLSSQAWFPSPFIVATTAMTSTRRCSPGSATVGFFFLGSLPCARRITSLGPLDGTLRAPTPTRTNMIMEKVLAVTLKNAIPFQDPSRFVASNMGGSQCGASDARLEPHQHHAPQEVFRKPYCTVAEHHTEPKPCGHCHPAVAARKWQQAR